MVTIGIFYNYKRYTPERMIKKIIENIVADPVTAGICTQEYDPNTSIDILTEHFTDEYSPYFTEEAFDNAIATRLFFTFFKSPRKEGRLEIDSIELERMKAISNDITFYGIIKIKVISPDGDFYLQNWNILSRVVRSEGKWKFRYLTIEPGTK